MTLTLDTEFTARLVASATSPLGVRSETYACYRPADPNGIEVRIELFRARDRWFYAHRGRASVLAYRLGHACELARNVVDRGAL